MKKYVIFIFFTFIGVLVFQPSRHQHNNPRQCWITQENGQEYVEQIYGKNGTNLPLDTIFFLQQLFLEIMTLTPQEQSAIASEIIIEIDQQMLQNTDEIHTKFLTIRKKHLKQFLLPQPEKQSLLKNSPCVQKILSYIQLEDDTILNSPKNSALFYAATKSCPLPNLIHFFQEENNRTLLLNNNVAEEQVKVQLLESFLFQFAMDMTIAIIVSQGASLANSIYASQSQKLYARLMKNKQAIEANMKAFLQKSQDDQQQSLQTMISLFSKTQQSIQKQTQDAAQNINAELTFLHKNISLEKPQQNFLFGQTDFDQIFAQGNIATNLQQVWKDPFHAGSWQYDKAKKTFLQSIISPVFIEMENESGAVEKSAIQAENNSIFTEFYTHERKYSIQGNITIKAVEFPFFSGIIFNKGRWISGNYESVRKCRLFGVYGASPSDINFCFAEQYVASEEQMKSLQLTDPIQTPLQQIIQGNKKQGAIDPVLIKNISIYPLQIAFTIITEPTQVTIKTMVNQKTEQFIINKLNPQLFIYHGIGCMSPGAQTDFILQTPQSITI